LKSDLAKLIIDSLAPIGERYRELRANPSALNDVIAHGAKKASAVADVTYQKAASAMGLI
jgi:tryptophanyl-tRNA synthetase